MEPAEFVQKLAQELESEPVHNTVKLDFGENDRYIVDCRERPVQIVDAAEFEQGLGPADCSLTVTFAKCKALFEGSKRQLLSAILAGQLKVDGDRAVLRQIGPSMGRAFKSRSATPSSPSSRTDANPTSPRRWVPDSERRACAACSTPFGLLNRRHHCRMCGDIFCSPCSSTRWMPYNVRICGDCHNRLQARSAPATPDASADADFRTPRRAASQAAAARAMAGGGAPIPLETPTADRTRSPGTGQADDSTHPLLLGTLKTKIAEQQAKLVTAHHTFEDIDRAERDSSKHETLKTASNGGFFLFFGVTPMFALAVGLLIGAAWQSQLGSHPISAWPDQLAKTMNVSEWPATVTSFPTFLRELPSAQELPSAIRGHVASINVTNVVTDGTMIVSEKIVRPAVQWSQSLDTRAQIIGVVGVLAILVGYFAQNLLIRRIRVYGTALRVFGGLKFMKSTEHWRAHLSEEDNEKEWNKVHDRLAQRVLGEILYLKGFWVKAGQYLSSRADILPAPWVTHLSKLQDEMPPADVNILKATVAEEFGMNCDDLFTFFNETPLGTASIAQVHRAVLRATGEEVVVKVQHRGINSLMRQDLVNMERIVSWVAYAEPDFDFKPIINEWAKVAIDELDFQKEAAHQKTIGANLARANIPVRVPKLTSLDGKEMVTSKVIMMEYCHGFKVTDADKMEFHKVDREALMLRICQAYAAQVYIDGMFNCDPHPGNILISVVNGVATPVLLDFGMTKSLDQDRRRAFASLIYSASSLDFGGLLQAFEHIGIKLKRDNPMEDMNNIRFVLRDTAPPAESRKKFRAFREEQWKKRQMLPRSQRNPVEAWPADLLFFFRVTLLLRGLCAALEVRLRYMSVLKPYAHMALLKAYPTQEHAVQIVAPPPENSGWTKKRADLEARIRDVLRVMYEEGEFVGVQVAAYHRGELVADVTAGTLGLADPRPVLSSTLFNCFSVTKAVTALAVHKLVDRGDLRYDDKVSHHWPEFAAEGKEDITVAHVLSHSAGLERAGVTALTLTDLSNWEFMLHKMARAQPSSPPGLNAKYHFLSFGWILGGLVRGVTHGRHLRDVVSEYIADPLGISEEMYLGFVDNDYPAERIATLINAFVEVEDGKIDSNSLNKLMERFQGLQQQGSSTEPAMTSGDEGGDVPTPLTVASEADVPNAQVQDESPEDAKSSLPAHLQQKMDSLVEDMLDHTTGARSSTEWEELETTKGIRIWQHKKSTGSAVRGHGRIKASIHAIFSVLENSTNKSRFDEKFIEQRFVERLTDDTSVVSERFNGIWPVQGRDFCAIQHVRRFMDGTLVMCGTDYPHPDCPPTKDFTRGEVILTGYVMRPVGPKGQETDVHYVVMTDLKGNVPVWILKQVAKSQPLNIYRLGKVVEQDVLSGSVLSAPSTIPAVDPSTQPAPLSQDQEDAKARAATVLRAVDQLNNDVESKPSSPDLGGPSKGSAISVLADPCIYNTPKIRKACIPSANGHFSARALAKMYAALSAGGSLDGAEILSPPTAAQIGVTRSSSSLGLSGFSVEWGLGVRKFAFSSGEAVRKTAFGHGGMGGSIALCDPAEEFAIAVTLNKLTLTSEVSTRLVDLVSTELGVGSFIRYGYEVKENDDGGIF